jgi:hypothetical protein
MEPIDAPIHVRPCPRLLVSVESRANSVCTAISRLLSGYADLFVALAATPWNPGASSMFVRMLL